MPETPTPLPPDGTQVATDLAYLAVLLEPEWSQSFTIRSSFATGISTSKSGKEQRIALRGIPVREMEYRASGIVKAGLPQLKAQALKDAQSRNFLPLSCDQTTLLFPASAGGSTLEVASVQNRRFQVGGYLAVFWHLAGSAQVAVEQAEITDISGNVITLGTLLASNYPAGATVVPLVACELRTSMKGDIESDGAGFGDMAATELSDPSLLLTEGEPVFPRDEEYYGPYPIFPEIQDYGNGASWAVLRDAESNQVGNAATLLARGTRPVSTYELNFLSTDREKARRLLRFFETQKGACLPFFFASPMQELSNPQPLSSGGDYTGATCESIFPLTDWDDRPFIGFVFEDGTTAIRSVASKSEIDGTQTLTLDAPIPGNKPICRITKAYFGRFDSDALEEEWVTDGVVTASLGLRELLDVPPMPLLPLRLANCVTPATKRTPPFNLCQNLIERGLMAYGEDPTGWGALTHEDGLTWSIEQYSGLPGADSLSIRGLFDGGCPLDDALPVEFELSAEEVGDADVPVPFELSAEEATDFWLYANFTFSMERIG